MGERDSAPSRGSGGQGREEWLQLVARSAGSDDPKDKRILSHGGRGRGAASLRVGRPREAADYPGCPPRRRGASAAQGINGWDIRPQRAELDPEAVNTAILEDLEQGATSIALRLDTALARGSALPEATVAYDLPALDRALRDVPIDLVLWRSRVASGSPRAPRCFLRLPSIAASRRPTYRRGSVPIRSDASPVAPGSILTQRSPPRPTSPPIRGSAGPSVRPLVADGSPYHEGGATAAQELACVMATVIYYLRRLESDGNADRGRLRRHGLHLDSGCRSLRQYGQAPCRARALGKDGRSLRRIRPRRTRRSRR